MQFTGTLVFALATALLSEEPPELRTSIRLLTQHPKLGENIFVEVLVQNIGLTTATLRSRMAPHNGVNFVIVDPAGERLPFTRPIFCGDSGTDEGVRLEMFHKFGTDFEIGKFYRFKRPGTYEVSAVYMIEKPRTAEFTLVRSATISFYVSGTPPLEDGRDSSKLPRSE